MDAIESMDWGAYSHFGFTAKKLPVVLPWMHDLSHLGGPWTVGLLIVVVLLLLLGQKRRRAALVMLLSFSAAIAVIKVVHLLVPRHRPPDGQNILGPGAMVGSYPSSSVFLFMLAMIFLGAAMWETLQSPWLRGLFVLAAGVFTVGVCLSQLFLALHFVTDLIGAIVGAALIGWIACRLMANMASSQA